MKRLIFVLALFTLALSACSGGGVYDQSYMASGDGTHMVDLNQTSQFPRNEDLNAVIKLNSHDSSVEVKATFFDPDSNQVGDPLVATADEDTGTVVLGLDWEAKEDGEFWDEGVWKAVIEVDGEEVDTLEFTVGS